MEFYRNDSQRISQNDGDEMEVLGYQSSHGRTAITWIGYIFSLGLLRLGFHWYPHFGLMATHKRCPLNVATKLLIVDVFQGKYKTYFVKDVKLISACDIRLSSSKVDNSNNGFQQNDFDVNKLIFQLEDGTHHEIMKIRAFWVKKSCYIWNDSRDKFMALSGLDTGVQNIQFHQFTGLSEKQQAIKGITYGRNEISVPVQSIPTLIVLEALTPFYMFQVFSLIVWFTESYWTYAIMIIIMSLYGIASSVIQTRKNQMNLRSTVHSTELVQVNRGGNVVETISSADLVPGDVLLIPMHGCTMLCDAVLLEGNCVVNESMLTGESIPVTKTPLPKTEVDYNLKADSNHTLYCGTRIIQTKFYGGKYVRAVVIRTGYSTTKGQLVRSILYPPPADFKFDRDSYKFIGILGAVAMAGFIYTIVSKSSHGIDPSDVFIKALDIITIALPPALPAAMTVGKLYAIGRLKKNRIFCMNSRVINVTGSINCVCFDKTGTLTEDGLDMWGVVPSTNADLKQPIKNIKQLPEDSSLLLGMVSCHSLTLIDEELSGDPLDLKMFESTGWVLEEPNEINSDKYNMAVPTIVRPANSNIDVERNEKEPELAIIQQNQFSSTLQRMSVVTKTVHKNHFEVYCKGSPEMIISLSKAETVPENLMPILKTYTEQGYRVLAIGNRTLEEDYQNVSKIHRNEIEKDLNFQGLIIFENQLKPQTTGVIEVLKKAEIKIVMITGDNIQTALSVARECGIVGKGETIFDVTVIPPDKSDGAKIEFHETGTEQTLGKTLISPFQMTVNEDLEKRLPKLKRHITMTGNSWALVKEHFPNLIPKLVTRGTVFARMSGEQKQQLVSELQNLGYYVAMCGDGANDCGALKAAHTGISLSEAEASVASPFTSAETNISCVPKIIREGRAALVTSFGVFKFMVAYSLTQFMSTIILYGVDDNLTSLQFLYIDAFLIITFASVFGKTKVYQGPLVRTPPMTSLLGVTPLTSLVLFLAVGFTFQWWSYYFIQTFDWFVPFVYDAGDSLNYASHVNYAVFTTSQFQYIIMAVVFSKGAPYREPFYTNFFLLSFVIITSTVCVYVTLCPAEWIRYNLELKLPETYDIRFIIIIMAFVNFVISLIIESFFVEFILNKKLKPCLKNIEKSSKKYLKVEKDLSTDPRWPASASDALNENEVVIYEKEPNRNGYVNQSFESNESITNL